MIIQINSSTSIFHEECDFYLYIRRVLEVLQQSCLPTPNVSLNRNLKQETKI